jgi:hypothetical protein
MRVTTGRVVDGRIEVPEESFAEGETVTMLAPEGDETFAVSPEDEAALLAAMAESDRGEVTSLEDFLREVGRGD